MCGLVLSLCTFPSIAQDHTVGGIEIDLPSDRMQLMQTSASVSMNLVTDGICEQVQLLDAGAMLCHAHDFAVALISGGDANITTIAAMRDGEYLGQVLGMNSPVTSLGMFLEDGHYEILVQETTNDGIADSLSFMFEIDFWKDGQETYVPPTKFPTSVPTDFPAEAPTESPTATPTESPTARPTQSPTATPTDANTAIPEVASTDPVTVAVRSDQASGCQEENGYASLLGRGVEFDLLCKTNYPETIELGGDSLLQVTVHLARYKRQMNLNTVSFQLHFAIDRGKLKIVQNGTSIEETLSDSGGNLKDFQIRTANDAILFEIINSGFRSAIFDLSVRPD